MVNVDVSDETMDKIEEIQSTSEYRPTKKNIVGKAIDKLHEIKVQSETTESTN